MKFFLDTANLHEIREANALGILDGITTNPSLIAKEGKPFSALAGAHVATIPFNVLDLMFKHPLTDRGLEQFLKDWEKAKS